MSFVTDCDFMMGYHGAQKNQLNDKYNSATLVLSYMGKYVGACTVDLPVLHISLSIFVASS